MIIIEGPDGAGKSYLVDRFIEQGGFFRYPTQGPAKTRLELLSRILTLTFYERDLAWNGQQLICDRFSLFSEQVYGPILRGHCLLTESDIETCNHLLENNAYRPIIIYCRPSMKTLRKVNLKSKPHKSQNHVEQVEANLEKIRDAYDNLFLSSTPDHFPMRSTVVYNRDEMHWPPIKELFACAD